MTVGQIAIAFKACGKILTGKQIFLLDRKADSVFEIMFLALGLDMEEFEIQTNLLQNSYGLSGADVLDVIEYVRNLRTSQGSILDIRHYSDDLGRKSISVFYEELLDTYVNEVLGDIFENSGVEYDIDYGECFLEKGKIPFTFEGETDFIEAIKASDFQPLIKIIKASAPHLDFSDKA